jgi:protein KIAA0664 homolog
MKILSPIYLHCLFSVSPFLDKKKKLRPDSVDCTPPDYILPNNKERPLTALQPQIKEQKVKFKISNLHFYLNLIIFFYLYSLQQLLKF